MIIRNNPGQSPGYSSGSSPSRLIIELEGDHDVGVSIEWAEDVNIEAFAHVLLYLSQGKMIAPIINAVHSFGASVGDLEGVGYITEVLRRGLVPAGGEAVDSDEPVICPTQAVKINMQSFRG